MTFMVLATVMVITLRLYARCVPVAASTQHGRCAIVMNASATQCNVVALSSSSVAHANSDLGPFEMPAAMQRGAALTVGDCAPLQGGQLGAGFAQQSDRLNTLMMYEPALSMRCL
jgi:hypothetical protein